MFTAEIERALLWQFLFSFGGGEEREKKDFCQSKQPKFARTLARVRSHVRGRFVHTGFVGAFILDMFVDTKDTYVRRYQSSCVVVVVVVVCTIQRMPKKRKALRHFRTRSIFNSLDILRQNF